MNILIGLVGYALVPIGLAIVFGIGVALIAAGAELVYIAYVNQPEPSK